MFHVEVIKVKLLVYLWGKWRTFRSNISCLCSSSAWLLFRAIHVNKLTHTASSHRINTHILMTHALECYQQAFHLRCTEKETRWCGLLYLGANNSHQSHQTFHQKYYSRLYANKSTQSAIYVGYNSGWMLRHSTEITLSYL